MSDRSYRSYRSSIKYLDHQVVIDGIDDVFDVWITCNA